MSRRIFEEALGDSAREPLLTTRLDDSSPDSDTEVEVIFEQNNTNAFEKREQMKLSYEEAVEEAGFGLFHGLLLVVCGWANASDAVEILCVSFLLPTARCDLQLRSVDMGLLTASIFLGMMVGGYFWGYLADQRGRKTVLVISLTVNGVFGALASLAPIFWLFLLLRFISGVGVGGSIPVIFSYFSEFQPRTRRGAMISALATFWMAGNILAAGLAWLVIPSTTARFVLGSLDFQSWRLFVVLCSIPSLSSAFVFALAMPESPKFLMETGREAEALEVFRKMFMLNQRGSAKPFSVCQFGHRPIDKHATGSEYNCGSFRYCTNCLNHVWSLDSVMGIALSISGLVTMSGCERNTEKASHHFAQFFKKGLDPIRLIFTKPLTARSVVLLIIFFCISFGYYGLWMWFPELFKRTESGGSPCANVSHPSSSSESENCYPVKTTVYMEGFVTAASNLPGNIFTILLMDFVGGKILLSCSLLLSGISVFFIWAVKSKAQSLVMSCVFSAVSVISWNALDVISTELYPTQLRSSALGFFTGVGRIGAISGNIVFGQLVDSNCAVPVLLVSALLFSGGLAALRLPQTKQTELI